MKLVKDVIEWKRDPNTSHVAFVAKGLVDDNGKGHEYTMVVAFSTEFANWTTFLALDGSQVHMSEAIEMTTARRDVENALHTALAIRS